MPSRPPHPWAPIRPYRDHDDDAPAIFMSPSNSLETINHDIDHDNNDDTPIVSRTAPLSPRRRAAQGGAVPYNITAHVPTNNFAVSTAGEAYSDNPHDQVSNEKDESDSNSNPNPNPFGDPVQHAFPFPHSHPQIAPGLYDPAEITPGSGSALGSGIPGAYPSSMAGGNGADPTIFAFSNPYMMNQELCAIPYQPMEPRFKRWVKSEVQPEDMVLPLLLITFQTGVIDAATIKDFRTYTTGQTGNSILLALAVFGRRPANLLAAGLSMAGFCIFAIVFGQLGNIYGHKTRGWLLFSMSVQILLLIANIVLVSPSLMHVLPQGGPFEWAVIFTAAAQGAGQMVMAINSGVPEINTVGLTGLYTALGSDPTLFKLLSEPHVTKRNRRLMFLVIFWGGTFFGGAIATYSDMWISLIFALECKVVALGILMLSSAFEVQKDWKEQLKKDDAMAEASWAD